MTREQLIQMYKDAKYIYTVSRLSDVRHKARDICIAIEGYIGQLSRQPADTWKV